MNALLSRRTLLGASTAAIGAVTMPGIATSGRAPVAGPATLSTGDARLAALADAYQQVERRCAVHTAAVRGLSLAEQDEEGFHEIARHLIPIEDEMAELQADTLAGVVAKARLCRSKGYRDSGDTGVLLSLADDVWRLLGKGELA